MVDLPCHGRGAQTGHGQVYPYPLCFGVQEVDRVGALKQILSGNMVLVEICKFQY